MRRISILSAVLGIALSVPGRAAADDLTKDLAILRAKPATVLILTEVGGQVRTRCGTGSFRDVTVPPFGSTGTGFIVHADGWIITNGHVVQPYYEPDEDQFRQGILRAAVLQGCVGPTEEYRGARLAQAERGSLLERLMATAAKDATVTVRKAVTVFLAGGRSLPAEVKIYSGPIVPAPTEQEEARAAAMGRMGGAPKGGRDVAVLKVAAAGLPVVRLGDSDRVRVGDPVLILGFPGVVLQHELLSRATRTEASVTSGEISALRKDAAGNTVLQTDAAVSWGNSGGPMVNARGEVVGIVTFISLADGGQGQAVQGFNFAVPVNTAREVAGPASIDFNAPSPFNALWDPALDAFNRGYLASSIAKLETLAKQAPDQPDVARFLRDAKARYASLSFYQRNPGWKWGAIAVALAAGIAGTLAIARQHGKRHAAEIKHLAREELLNLLRSGQPGLGLAGAAPARVTILDVRAPEAVAERPFALPGAVHMAPDDVLEKCNTLPVTENLVLYCD
jgi:S1-C subfamily serine protease